MESSTAAGAILPWASIQEGISGAFPKALQTWEDEPEVAQSALYNNHARQQAAVVKNVVSRIPQPGLAEAEQGMIAPKPELLEPGSYIYRFADHRARFGYHAGAWWIRREDFESIVQRAQRAGIDLGQKARWDLAVLQKWGSRMNVVVEARVTGRIWAWVGLAKPQREEINDQVFRMCGHRQIRQLFLYGLTDGAGILTARGRESLAITGAKVIQSTPLR